MITKSKKLLAIIQNNTMINLFFSNIESILNNVTLSRSLNFEFKLLNLQAYLPLEKNLKLDYFRNS